MIDKFKHFLRQHEQQVKPLFKEKNQTYFKASISGDKKDYQKAAELELKFSKIYADKKAFKFLQDLRHSGAIQEPMLNRQLDVLYRAYLGKQIEPNLLETIVRLQNKIEQAFATFRCHVNGRILTDNQIEDILRHSTNTSELEEAWLASKKIGEQISDDVLSLVNLRNRVAKTLDFENYHSMQLQLSEQDPAEIERLFDDLDRLTRQSFTEQKEQIDAFLADRLNLGKADLMPWHYQNRFFQEAPKIHEVDLDRFYKDQNLVRLTTNYYAGVGLDVDDIIKNSDLFEKAGKYQHAYCVDVDHEGDIRVVCNIKPNYNWMSTMLHEFGHAVYDKYHDPQVPWLLREPAHIFTTEAIAMFFGRLASNAHWIQAMIGLPNDKKDAIAATGSEILKLEQVVFCRWVQVVYRFEKRLYENPDQDLNTLWWDLVENYQLLRKPPHRNAPDWAAKIHIALYPAYYHNYMLGELLASQLAYILKKDILRKGENQNSGFTNDPVIGAFLKEKIFKPGNTITWKDMIKQATGEPLTAAYYAQQFFGK